MNQRIRGLNMDTLVPPLPIPTETEMHTARAVALLYMVREKKGDDLEKLAGFVAQALATGRELVEANALQRAATWHDEQAKSWAEIEQTSLQQKNEIMAKPSLTEGDSIAFSNAVHQLQVAGSKRSAHEYSAGQVRAMIEGQA